MFFRSKNKASYKYDFSDWVHIDYLFANRFVDVAISESNTFIYLEVIKVKEKYRNKKHGSAVLKKIIKYAIKKRKSIFLEATDVMGSEINRLYNFYENHGFVQGKIDYIAHRHNMHYLVPNSLYYQLVESEKNNIPIFKKYLCWLLSNKFVLLFLQVVV